METIQMTVRTSEEAEILRELLKALDFVESVSNQTKDINVQTNELPTKILGEVNQHAGSLNMPEDINYKDVLSEELTKKYTNNRERKP